MLTLSYNGKNYQWKEEQKWGTIPILEIDCPLNLVHAKDDRYKDFNTWHTPEQLVKLWYLIEEKEWTPTPWEIIEVSDDQINWKRKRFEYEKFSGAYEAEWVSYIYARPLKKEEKQDFREPPYEEMVAMWMPTKFEWLQGYLHDPTKTMNENQEERNRVLWSIQDDWKREHGFLPPEKWEEMEKKEEEKQEEELPKFNK